MAKKNDMTLGEALDAFLSANGMKEKALVQRAISEWVEIVGKQVAEHTGRMWFAKGIFYVEMSHPAWRQELQMGKSKIKSLINKHLGASLVEEVRIF
jgi:predicted nucleic acid-binding Zn ribbon protein